MATERNLKKVETTLWTPQEAGDRVGGIIKNIEKGVKYDNLIATLESDDGDVVKVPLSTVLESKFADAALSNGDYVEIEFVGERENEKGTQTYRDFDIFVEE